MRSAGAPSPSSTRAPSNPRCARVAGVSDEQARALARQSSYVTNARRTALLVTAAGDLFLFDFRTRTPDPAHEHRGRGGSAVLQPRRLPRRLRARRQPARGGPRPAGGGARAHPRRLGRTCSTACSTGCTRRRSTAAARFQGYWWSPDSRRLALPPAPGSARAALPPGGRHRGDARASRYTRYPKAGDPEPGGAAGHRGGLGRRPALGGPRAVTRPRSPWSWTSTWSPDSRRVLFQVQDRAQTWLDLDDVDAATLRLRTLLREKTKAWVERQDDARHLAARRRIPVGLSERTGWKHVYRYRGDGTLVGPVTGGEWEARALHGVDEAGGWIYFSGTERSPIGADVYRDPARRHLACSGCRARRAHMPRASIPPSRSTSTPGATSPRRPRCACTAPTAPRCGSSIGNPAPALAEYRLARPELLRVPTRDGFPMEALLLRPPDFDPGKRYPVYQHAYGGPHAPVVKNAWGGTTLPLPSAAGPARHRGLDLRQPHGQRQGRGFRLAHVPQLRRAGAARRRGRPGLAGPPGLGGRRRASGSTAGAGGGYLVTYALTHSRRFAMGIAGGPVTDWHNYDSVYTERYMDLPSRNAEGYRRSSPRHFAADLHGRLLLVHGAIDDNVHPQNTTQFAYELQKARRPFQHDALPAIAARRHRARAARAPQRAEARFHRGDAARAVFFPALGRGRDLGRAAGVFLLLGAPRSARRSATWARRRAAMAGSEASATDRSFTPSSPPSGTRPRPA